MQAALGPETELAYCTNVHAGPTYEQTLMNLQRHALAVKQQVSPDQPMGVGLWLSAQAARKLVFENRADELRQWLDDHGLYVFTLNGFPYGDFHRDRVKHQVYQPDWTDRRRLDYTLDLVHILARLLPDESQGSISTLPIGWPSLMHGQGDAETTARAASTQLLDLVHHLARIELDTGKLIHVALEPEPGCWFDTAQGAIDFFNRYLLGHADDLSVRSYLRLCHDVCHAAVMFEDQHQVLQRYYEAGLHVGKVQVSSAVRVDFDPLDAAQRRDALDQLRGFAEDRYLHQTVVRHPDGSLRFHDDLADALAAVDGDGPVGQWRVHFHVPIYLESFGHLQTSRDAIDQCLPKALALGVRHFEVETYAWGVLPESLQVPQLADGIAREMNWLRQQSLAIQP